MDCTRTSVRQGAKRGDARLPPRHEGHARLERGPRGHRRRRQDDLRGRADPRHHRRRRQGHRRRVHPHAAGRARRIGPAPTRAGAGQRVRRSIATGSCWPSARAPTCPGSAPATTASQRQPRHGSQADAVTFDTGRPGVFGTRRRPHRRRDRRPGRRRGPPLRLCGGRVPQGRRTSAELRTRQTLAEPQPQFLSIVPYTDEPKEPRNRLKALPAKERHQELRRVRDPLHAGRGDGRVDPLPAVHLRGDRRSATCADSASSTAPRSRPSSRPTTPGAGFRSVTENRFTGANHDYIRDDSHAFILREPSRCIDCGRCAQVCAEVVGAACYDFMRTGFDTLVTTPLDMSLNDTPCVSCGRCAETCPTGALMPKPRVLEKYEVDESRCILCGICVDACPYDALRDGQDTRARPHRPRRADDRPDRARGSRSGDRGHLHSARARLDRPCHRGRPDRPTRPRSGSWPATRGPGQSEGRSGN